MTQQTFHTEIHEPKWFLVIKGFMRPIITIGLLTTFIYMIFHRNEFTDKDMEYMFFLTSVVVVFWFLERTLRNIGLADFMLKLIDKVLEARKQEIRILTSGTVHKQSKGE